MVEGVEIKIKLDESTYDKIFRLKYLGEEKFVDYS